MKSIRTIYKSPLFILFWVVATELVGFGMIIPVLPQITARFAANGVWIGVLLASYSLVQFFAAPILGSLSDRYGRRPILIFSKLGSMAGYLLFAVSSSFWMLLLARVVDGFSGGNISVARAYAADVTTPENRSKGMAVIGIAFGTGFILGPALGGVLYGIQGGGLFWPGCCAAALSGVALLLTIFWLPETQNRSTTESVFSKLKNIPVIFSNSKTSLILSFQLLYMIIFSGFETSISVFLFHQFKFTEQHNSLMFLYIGLLALVFQGYFSRKKLANHPKVIQIGFVIGSLSLVALALSQTIGFVFASLALLSLSICIINVFLPAYFSEIVPESTRGASLGVFESIGSLSRVVGPLIVFTVLFGHLRIGYVLASIGFLIPAILFWTISSLRSQTRQQQI